MLRRVILILLLAGAPAFAQPDRADRLIQQLGSPVFAEREEAMKALDALGAAALDALKKAAKHPDAETRRRAEDLVGRIERRLESARVLAPSKHIIRYQDIPLLDAVNDIAKKGGLSITVHGDLAKLKNKTLTLDRAETEFWPAFELFCRQAGLVEAPSVEMPLALKLPPQLQRPQAPPVLLPRGQFVLIEGNATDMPTCYSGAARIRALPPGTVREGPGQVVCTLGVAVENGLELLRVTGVRVDKAIDDLGQPLAAVVLIGGDPTVGQPPVIIENVGGKPQARLATPGQYQVPVRLSSGPKPSTKLTELAGALHAELRTRPEPVMIVDNVLKAAGQKVAGKAGGWLLVQQLTRGDDGVIAIRMEILTGANSRPGAGPSLGLTLLNDKGQSLPQAAAPTWSVLVVDGNTIHQVTARFKAMGEPARLVYSDTRVVSLEVPFAFKDVPVK